jgi:hypothetical protein
MYCIVLSIMLFSNKEWIWCSTSKNLQACYRYQVLSPSSVEIGCLPYSSKRLNRKRLATTNMFLSFDIFIERISLSFVGSIATYQSQINSDPILITVSSTTNSSIFFLLHDTFCGLYLCIHFHIDT